MRGIRRLLGATVVALTTSVVADAGNLSFLAKAPIAQFNSEDIRLLRETAMALLLHEEVGASRSWGNPQTTASGKITIVKAFESADGFRCKTLLIENSAGGLHGRGTYPVCEIIPGSGSSMPVPFPLRRRLNLLATVSNDASHSRFSCSWLTCLSGVLPSISLASPTSAQAPLSREEQHLVNFGFATELGGVSTPSLRQDSTVFCATRSPTRASIFGTARTQIPLCVCRLP